MPNGGALTVAAAGTAEEDSPLLPGHRGRDPGRTPAAHLRAVLYQQAGGTGLGLSITHNIISEHGGRIEVESPPGEGTVFTLRFPLDAVPPGIRPS